MRVAIVTESFFPQVNGVTNTVRHTVDRLRATGHEVLLVAPGPGQTRYRDVRVVRVRSMALPRYTTFPVGLPDKQVVRALAEYRPDVVHLASPVALGAVGQRAATKLGIPTVAVFQTDVGAFAKQYGIPAEPMINRWIGRIHRRADRNLVPSNASLRQLADLGVTDLHLWRRGVSTDLFSPEQRNADIHRHWTRREPGQLTVGYVGRLAAEKQVRRLAELSTLPGVRLVVIGDGPERAWLGKHLPGAKFTGMLRGHELAQAFASLDVFVHTGTAETFCQTVQEAQASGVPVVAPASGGPLDLVDHGRTGLLYDPTETGALRRSVQRLTLDPALRARVADEALQAVRRRSWPSVVDELLTVHYPAVTGAAGDLTVEAG